MPVAIVHHGLGGQGKKLIWLAVPLAMKGFIVILPDARAHGDSMKRLKKARKDDCTSTTSVAFSPIITRS